MSEPPTIDLLDLRHYETEGQPHGLFRWLRRNDPVHRHAEPNGPGFWAVTRYRDVEAVSRDPATYSSALGGIMIADGSAEELAGARNMMLYMDPPRHVRFRKLVRAAFTPASAERLKPRISELAAEIVDEVIERGECDFVADVAGELPSYVIAALMGVPLDDGRRLYLLTEKMHSDPSVVSPQDQRAASAEMLGYAHEIAAQKRKRRGDDLASALVDAEVEGERLSDEEFDWFFLLLVNAGGDTTRISWRADWRYSLAIPASSAACKATSIGCCLAASKRCFAIAAPSYTCAAPRRGTPSSTAGRSPPATRW